MVDAATDPPPGVMAEFADPQALVAAVRQARAAGFSAVEAFTPWPVAELDQALGLTDRRVPWLTLAGGLLGGAVGFGLPVVANLAFPIDIGGRPLIAVPAFLMIAFELMVLGAVLAAIGGMLLLNRLPRLHHPVFDVAGFDLASPDRFFLLLAPAADGRFDRAAARRFLETLAPARILPAGPEPG